jgi:hypothetical protein
VKGHSGNEGNENADRLANVGCTYAPQDERNWALEGEKWNLRMATLNGIEMEIDGTRATARQDREDTHPASVQVSFVAQPGERSENETRSESNSDRGNIIISDEVCPLLCVWHLLTIGSTRS